VFAKSLLWAACLLAASASQAATLEGQVTLTLDGKTLRPEEAAEAVVYFRPAAPVAAPPAKQAVEMLTLRKQFSPRILPVTVGSEVRFPNQDPILHNAFSTSKDNGFDIGLYGQGEGKAQRFDHAGYVRVYCNVHHSMVGHILVLDTPFFARPDAQGRFRLKDLPAGKGDLVVWFDRAAPWHAQLSVAARNEPVTVKLELAQKKIPPHMNKFGKPYGRSSDGGY
jgi:plastocyanin